MLPESQEFGKDTFYRIKRFESTENPVATIAVVEDLPQNIDSLKPQLNKNGYTLIGVYVDPDYQPTDMQQRVLARDIIDLGVDLAICDKGLGYTDGIGLVLRLKEAEVPTIMLTGERETRETHRVADRFIVKPIRPSILIEELDEMFAITRENPEGQY